MAVMKRATVHLPSTALSPVFPGRRRLATVLGASTILLLLLAVFAPAAAAAPEPEASETRLVQEAPEAPFVEPAPQSPPAEAALIDTPAEGAFLGSNTLTVSGSGVEAGNTVTARVGESAPGGMNQCTAEVEQLGADPAALAWGCTIAFVDNGANRTIVATESDIAGPVRQQSTHFDVLGPPSIDDRSPTIGAVSGVGHPGSKLSVTLGGGVGGCVATVTSSEYWSCELRTAAGSAMLSGSYQVAASQTHTGIGAPGDRSATALRPIIVDNVRPAPPTIITPAGDYRIIALPATFSGTSAEPAGVVTVYVDGIPVCDSAIEGGRWSCIGGSGHRNGARNVTALQRDVAGNIGNETGPRRVFFGPSAATLRPTSSPTSTPTPTPDTTPSPTAAVPSVTPQPGTLSPYPVPQPSVPDAALDAATPSGNWGSPTGFGAALPTAAESIERGNWGRALLLALGAIVLVALPLRLLATSLRGRTRIGHSSITGRNRSPSDPVDEPSAPHNPWLMGFIPLAATAIFIVVSGGIDSEVRYLRLTFAVGLALALLNVVGVAVAARIGYRWQGVDGRLRFLPLLLLAAAVSGILSRLTGMSPPIVTGVLLGIRFAPETPVRKRAMVNLLQVVSVLALGIGGWFGHGLLGDPLGFWPTIASESLAAMCLAGIGSAFFLMIPLATLPGRVIFEWSRLLWLGVAFAGATLGFGIFLGDETAHFPLASSLLIAVAFAAVCIAIWVWLRFVRPTGGLPAASEG